MYKEVFEGADTPRVFVTNPDEPEDGRIFVWAKTRWYERSEGDSGAVAYPSVAETEDDLRSFLVAAGLDPELTELDEELAEEIREDFLDQTPLYPEAPELSHQQD